MAELEQKLFVKYFTKTKGGESFGTMVFKLGEQTGGLKRKLGEEGFEKLIQTKEATFNNGMGEETRAVIFTEDELKKSGLIDSVL